MRPASLRHRPVELRQQAGLRMRCGRVFTPAPPSCPLLPKVSLSGWSRLEAGSASGLSERQNKRPREGTDRRFSCSCCFYAIVVVCLCTVLVFLCKKGKETKQDTVLEKGALLGCRGEGGGLCVRAAPLWHRWPLNFFSLGAFFWSTDHLKLRETGQLPLAPPSGQNLK